MSNNRKRMTVRNWMHRGAAGFLCLIMLLGLLPGTALFAGAAEADEVTENWSTPYMNRLVDWGVMRGDIDGNLYPERAITRAEFVTMMNRAYGYDETGGNPFTDVYSQDWYYDDIDIAYNVGYFSGTSGTTATPNGDLTREQAAVLLARNMMLQSGSGETLGFSDSRELSEWSRGLVGAASDSGVINGYDDGSFRPQNNVTRGEVAAMLTRAVGTLISEPGSQSLGSVYGNLTINSSEVSLRNTTIVGNLYLTGGIGLGDVLLENVDVYGQIIVSGAGESNSSQSSVVMRNVTANELIVDNISNQFVTVRAEGDTRIASTSVRTNAYVEDTTPDGFGLSYIELNGEPGTRLQLAGNVKEVKNLTPLSSLEIVQGVASKVTSDEKATGSSVKVEAGARVDELNLDVGANVSGAGDIGSMNVGASGTNVSILPDNITVRPGITSNITGTTMDNVTAAESSADPRLLSGYPSVRNVAPNSATLAFSTNKAGTVYWAVSTLADGSVSEDDLMNNPVYGGNIFRSGRINAANSKTEYTAQVAGLTIDGSYYVTAMLVDSRGNHSPLKVTAFSTPDNTNPAFTSGYPVMTRNSTKTAQVTVMTNKSCQLFYALLPRGSSAPTPQEFKSGAVSGNLGYGVVDVVKNNTQPINVNSVQLEELTNYELYLWLNDYDNARSSSVRRVSFTTPDETPPVVTDIMQTNSAAAAVDVTYSLSEPGTLYWAIVIEGNDTFMNYDLNTTEAKVKVESGYSALRRGASSAARADTAIRLAISGLNSKTTGTTSYTVYYVAKDRAGNYAESVGMINVRTLDTEAPTVTQEFTKYNDDDKDAPLADTDINLVFSESIQGDSKGEKVFMTLYNDVLTAVGPEAQKNARERLASALREHITMYRVPATGQPAPVTERTKDNEGNASLDWTIDYRFATVRMEEGKMIISFPTVAEAANEPRSALDLDSGATYYFRLEGIYDNALTPNAMGIRELPQFRTVFARVSLSVGNTYSIDSATGGNANNDARRMDFNFIVDPISVDRVDPEMRWDMLIWTDTTLSFTLYSRQVDAEGTPVQGTAGQWAKVNKSPNDPMRVQVDNNEQDGFAYVSLTKNLLNPTEQRPDFPTLYNMPKTEYAIHIDSIGDSDNFTAWNHNVTFKISVVAGARDRMNSLSTGSFKSDYDAAIRDGAVSIGTPDPFQRRIPFTDSKAPEIVDGWPTITVGDISATIDVMLDRPGRVYYLVFPLSQLKNGNQTIDNRTVELTEDVIDNITDYATSVLVQGGSVIDTGVGVTPPVIGDGDKPNVSDVPRMGEDDDGKYMPVLPTVNTVTSGRFTADVISGTTNSVEANVATTIDLTNKLSPNTIYYVCLVTRGTSAVYSDNVLCYRFTTSEAVRPTINLSATGSTVNINVDKRTDLTYFLAQNGEEGAQFQQAFSGYAESADWADGFDATQTGTTGDNTTYLYKETDGNLSFTFTGELSDMSVVDAMATPCYNGSMYVGSVFDMYASTEAKNTYASLIRNSSVSGNEIVMTGSGTYRPENNDTRNNQVNCADNMAPRVLYTFMSVGKSSDGSGDAFRAYYSVSISDTTPPMVTNVIYNGDEITDNKFVADSNIIVTFSEQLYTVDRSGVTQQTYQLDGCASHSSEPNGDYYALGGLGTVTVGCSMQTESDHDSSNKRVTSIIFNLSEGKSTATVTFQPSTLCDQSRNGLGRNQLTIRVTIKKNSTTEMKEVTGADGTVTLVPVVVNTYEPIVTLTRDWNSTSWGNI